MYSLSILSFTCRNLNKLSMKHQLYQNSGKIDAFGKEIWFCHNHTITSRPGIGYCVGFSSRFLCWQFYRLSIIFLIGVIVILFGDLISRATEFNFLSLYFSHSKKRENKISHGEETSSETKWGIRVELHSPDI